MSAPIDGGRGNDPLDVTTARDDGAGASVPRPVVAQPSISPTDCTHTGVGTVYEVGPGKPYATIGAVPLATLAPGDMVRIFGRSEPYRETFLIASRGTAEAPIRICGVRGVDGARPVVSGERASFATSSGPISSPLDELGLVQLGYHAYADLPPAYVTIEGLKITSGRDGYSLVANATGQPEAFSQATSCVRIQRGEHILLRDNEITDCGWGLFVNTLPQAFETSRDIRVEGNWFHHNNPTGGTGKQDSYTQALGTVMQFNRFSSPGGSSVVKDRSTGFVFRYNSIEGATHFALDMVDPENNPEQAAGEPEANREAFVYGNIIERDQSEGGRFLNYGGDHWYAPIFPAHFRASRLHFYNNTVRLSERAAPYAASFMSVSTVREKVDLFNNILFYDGSSPRVELLGYSETQCVCGTNDVPEKVCFGRPSLDPTCEQGGTVHAGKNWINDNWKQSFAEATNQYHPKLGSDGVLGALTGADKFVTTPAVPIDRTTLRPTPALADAGEPIPNDFVVAGHDVVFEYDRAKGDPRTPLSQIGRRVVGARLALGALE